jgi:uncharacterized repeat protein (TIGR01451 family)
MPLTGKGLAYLGLAYFFIGSALVFRNPSLTAFVIPIAVLVFASSILSPVEHPSLRIVRGLDPPRSFIGESINVTVQVSNESQRQVNNLTLEDRVPEALVVEAGTKVLTCSLRPGEQFQYSYRISAPRRGRYALGPMVIRVTDLMGFRAYSAEIPEISTLTVLPGLEELGPLELRARRVGPWPGSVPSRRIGIGTEFYELRLYSPGDELRRVNWKASAKMAHLVTNEFEGEQVTDALVVLDCSEGTLSGLFAFDAADFQVTFAASLCSRLILQGNRVGLSVYGAARTWLNPAFGRRQLLRLLDELVTVKPGRATIPMDYAVQSLVFAVVPSRSVMIFISPLIGEEIANVIMNIAARGYSVICFTPVAGSKLEGTNETEVLAKRIIAAERRMRMMQVARVARVVELSPQRSVKSVLRKGSPWRRV